MTVLTDDESHTCVPGTQLRDHTRQQVNTLPVHQAAHRNDGDQVFRRSWPGCSVGATDRIRRLELGRIDSCKSMAVTSSIFLPLFFKGLSLQRLLRETGKIEKERSKR